MKTGGKKCIQQKKGEQKKAKKIIKKGEREDENW